MALNLKSYLYRTNDFAMKTIKYITSLLLMLILMTSFSQCSTAQKLQAKAPIEFGEVYAQKWVAGIKEGGSGINVFIPVNDNSIPLDSIFFRGKKVKMEFKKGDTIFYIGRFKTNANQQDDIILSSDMSEESKNRLPQPKEQIPFELKDDECVVSYRQNNKTLYYKISNIKMKQPLHYPSAPPNGQ